MKIIVQNLAVEYQDEGSGPTLLFLHGWQDNLHTFDALVAALVSAYRVVRLDLPGFGQSEMPPGAWNLGDYVGFVQDFLKKLGLSVDTIIGHSFGGRIAVKGAAAKVLPSRQLVLIGSAGLAQRRTLFSWFIQALAKAGGLIAKLPPLSILREGWRRSLYRRLGSDYLAAGALQPTFLKIIAEDLADRAAEIAVPTLLIWGSEDTETPLSDGERFSHLIPGAKLKVIRGAGHHVQREKPREVAELIKEFL